jgi:RNA polymerase sigma-70 factor, ECF subfamily
MGLDKSSFEQLFRSEFKPLVMLGVQYVKDYETARGLVQDAFISLWEKRETIDPAKPVRAYLSTSVRNKCLNHLRDNKKFSTNLLSIEQIYPDSVYNQPLRIEEIQLREHIDRALADLPEKCREVFELSRFRDMKYHEIAEHLGISVKTVEAQMSKALNHMRLRLKEFLTVLLFLAAVSSLQSSVGSQQSSVLSLQSAIKIPSVTLSLCHSVTSHESRKNLQPPIRVAPTIRVY